MSKNNIGILACAGAGKTYSICEKVLDENVPSLMVTYTRKGREAIINQLCELNSGAVPEFVTIETWYTFLLHEIIKPYQTAYFRKINNQRVSDRYNFVRSIDFSTTYGKPNFNKRGTFRYYFSNDGDLRQNETVELAIDLIDLVGELIIHRLEQQFKTIYFDEVQDLAGTDIKVIRKLIQSPLKVVMVGDPKQASYKTHNDTHQRKDFSGRKIGSLFDEFESEGLLTKCLKQQSRRFGDQIANLANQVDPSGELMTGNNEESVEHDGVFLIGKSNIPAYIKAYDPFFLIYDRKSLNKLPVNVSQLNYGESKGLTFNHVAIIPNGPMEKFLKGKPLSSPEKYYIAVTRARYSIAFVVNKPDQFMDLHPSWSIWEPPTE